VKYETSTSEIPETISVNKINHKKSICINFNHTEEIVSNLSNNNNNNNNKISQQQKALWE